MTRAPGFAGGTLALPLDPWMRRYLRWRYPALMILVDTIDLRDNATCSHAQAVSDIAAALAQRLGWSKRRRIALRAAALLHDIGKIGIADHLLRKPGPLDDHEQAIMRAHAALGARLIAPIWPDLAPIIRGHHERWDGTGYPDGLAGPAIPAAARIIAVADSYEAMTSDRPYRAGLPPDQVRAIFAQDQGRQWEPRVVAALLDQLRTE